MPTDHRATPRCGSLLRAAFLLSVSILALAGCAESAAPQPERPPAAVTVTTAVARDVPVYLEQIGRCAAREMVSILPQVSGRITEIHFIDGADLKKDQPLFTIDRRPYQAALDQASATLAQSKAQRELARIEFTREQSLLRSRSASRQDYDLRKNAVDVAEAQVLASQAAVEAARLNLDYCSILSPIPGRAGQRLVDLGNVVLANSTTPLLVIQRLDPIYADFTVPENDLSDVQQHMRAGTLKAEVRLPDGGGEVRTGNLTFLDNAVREDTGTVKLRATLDNPDRRFWPGRFVNVRLVLDTLKQAVLVPAAATQDSAKGPFVYVVKPDDTAELRPVTLGQRHADLVVVREGLKAGERVVTIGHLAVIPGGKVHVGEPTPPSAAGPQGARGKP